MGSPLSNPNVIVALAQAVASITANVIAGIEARHKAPISTLSVDTLLAEFRGVEFRNVDDLIAQGESAAVLASVTAPLAHSDQAAKVAATAAPIVLFPMTSPENDVDPPETAAAPIKDAPAGQETEPDPPEG